MPAIAGPSMRAARRSTYNHASSAKPVSVASTTSRSRAAGAARAAFRSAVTCTSLRALVVEVAERRVLTRMVPVELVRQAELRRLRQRGALHHESLRQHDLRVRF